MKKILLAITLILCAVCIMAQTDSVDLKYKFTDKEAIKNNVKIVTNGTINFMGTPQNIKDTLIGKSVETTTAVTETGTAKKALVFDLKEETPSADKTIANALKPKATFFEMTPKGAIVAITDEKGKVTTKVEKPADVFPKDPIKIGDKWTSTTVISSMSIPAESTFDSIQEVDGTKYALIKFTVNSPVDMPKMMALFGVSQDMMGGFDSMVMNGLLKGTGTSYYDIKENKIAQTTYSMQLNIAGTMYDQPMLEATINIDYAQKLFSKEDEEKEKNS